MACIIQVSRTYIRWSTCFAEQLELNTIPEYNELGIPTMVSPGSAECIVLPSARE